MNEANGKKIAAAVIQIRELVEQISNTKEMSRREIRLFLDLVLDEVEASIEMLEVEKAAGR